MCKAGPYTEYGWKAGKPSPDRCWTVSWKVYRDTTLAYREALHMSWLHWGEALCSLFKNLLLPDLIRKTHAWCVPVLFGTVKVRFRVCLRAIHNYHSLGTTKDPFRALHKPYKRFHGIVYSLCGDFALPDELHFRKRLSLSTPSTRQNHPLPVDLITHSLKSIGDGFKYISESFIPVLSPDKATFYGFIAEADGYSVPPFKFSGHFFQGIIFIIEYPMVPCSKDGNISVPGFK